LTVIVGDEFLDRQVQRAGDVAHPLAAEGVDLAEVSAPRQHVYDLYLGIVEPCLEVIEAAHERVVNPGREMPGLRDGLPKGDGPSFGKPALPPAV
jgi:hypothetical protein